MVTDRMVSIGAQVMISMVTIERVIIGMDTIIGVLMRMVSTEMVTIEMVMMQMELIMIIEF